jgi:uncharacterized protein
MTSYLIDINVWLALTWDGHPHHGTAGVWYQSIDDASLLFCRLTMLGLLRLLTNGQVMGDSVVTVREALSLYDRWNEDPRVELAREPLGMEGLFRGFLAPIAEQRATKAIADCYLASFAQATGSKLVTLDKGLAALAGARKQPVTLLRPRQPRN